MSDKQADRKQAETSLNEKPVDSNSSVGEDGVDASESLEERRLLRRLDGRILPIACLMYLFACELSADLAQHAYSPS